MKCAGNTQASFLASAGVAVAQCHLHTADFQGSCRDRENTTFHENVPFDWMAAKTFPVTPRDPG